MESREMVARRLKAVRSIMVLLSETKGEISDVECLYELMQDTIDECVEAVENK